MYKHFKRILDIIFSVLLIIVLLVPMLIVALLVKCTSKGPVFFKQERYGIESRKFTIFKFRTMYIETPELSNQEFNNIDKFITPLGGFLRKLSIDELPQLFNIFLGQMSFVGPRPLADSDYNVIKMRKVNGADKVRPGITGLAQVNGRNNILDEYKAHYDAIYAQNCNFKVDFVILVKTGLNVIMAKDINSNRSKI